MQPPKVASWAGMTMTGGMMTITTITLPRITHPTTLLRTTLRPLTILRPRRMTTMITKEWNSHKHDNDSKDYRFQSFLSPFHGVDS